MDSLVHLNELLDVYRGGVFSDATVDLGRSFGYSSLGGLEGFLPAWQRLAGESGDSREFQRALYRQLSGREAPEGYGGFHASQASRIGNVFGEGVDVEAMREVAFIATALRELENSGFSSFDQLRGQRDFRGVSGGGGVVFDGGVGGGRPSASELRRGSREGVDDAVLLGRDAASVGGDVFGGGGGRGVSVSPGVVTSRGVRGGGVPAGGMDVRGGVGAGDIRRASRSGGREFVGLDEGALMGGGGFSGGSRVPVSEGDLVLLQDLLDRLNESVGGGVSEPVAPRRFARRDR